MANPTTKSRARPLSSSSDEEENRCPRKAARPVEPTSDSDESSSSSNFDDRVATPAQLTQCLLALQAEAQDAQSIAAQVPEGEGSGEEDDAEEGSQSAEGDDQDTEEVDQDENDNSNSDDEAPIAPRPRRKASPPRIGHRIDDHHLARLAATIICPLSDDVTGADFSYESNLGYGNDTAVGRLVRLRRWSQEVGYETFGDGYDENGEPIEDDSEEGRDLNTPPPDLSPVRPSVEWDGDEPRYTRWVER